MKKTKNKNRDAQKKRTSHKAVESVLMPEGSLWWKDLWKRYIPVKRRSLAFRGRHGFHHNHRDRHSSRCTDRHSRPSGCSRRPPAAASASPERRLSTRLPKRTSRQQNREPSWAEDVCLPQWRQRINRGWGDGHSLSTLPAGPYSVRPPNVGWVGCGSSQTAVIHVTTRSLRPGQDTQDW